MLYRIQLKTSPYTSMMCGYYTILVSSRPYLKIRHYLVNITIRNFPYDLAISYLGEKERKKEIRSSLNHYLVTTMYVICISSSTFLLVTISSHTPRLFPSFFINYHKGKKIKKIKKKEEENYTGKVLDKGTARH